MSTRSTRIAINLIAVLALFQVIRLAAFTIVQDALAGNVAEAWVFPAVTDVVVGAAAPFIAYGVWRGRGLGVWTAAIVFFSLSISDHLDAIAVVITSHGPRPSLMSGPEGAVVAQLVVMSTFELLAVIGLTRPSLRRHFLSPAMPH